MKKLVAVAVLGIGAVAARRYMSMWDALAAVPAELRNPLLPFTTYPMTHRTLPVIRLVYSVPNRSGPDVRVTERYVGVPTVRVLITTPVRRDSVAPAVLWIHGGGMTVGSPQFEAMGAGRLARELGAVVVSPAYRLAPENPFPAGLDDCMATLRWMRDHAVELGIDPDRIAVVGGSAGGGLAAAVAQRSHDEAISLRAQVLAYPMLDDRTALQDDHAGRGRFGWTPAANRFGWTAYLGREPRLSDAPEYAAPARRKDLAGLAPAWIGVGDLDLFYDEDVDYAEALKASGVPCQLVAVPGMYHGADTVAPKAPAMLDFRRGMTDWLKTYLS
ncbi:alpha/beta hydrolase [Mycobacterium sp. URHB0021]